MNFADTYNTRSTPQDEQTNKGWRIIRDGKLFARRETLGAARALVDRIERYAGTNSKWTIKA